MNAVRLHHVLLAVAAHAVLLIFLVLGAQCSSTPEPPQIIEGVIVEAPVNNPGPAQQSDATPTNPAPQQRPDDAAEETAKHAAEVEQQRQKQEESRKVQEAQQQRETQMKQQQAAEAAAAAAAAAEAAKQADIKKQQDFALQQEAAKQEAAKKAAAQKIADQKALEQKRADELKKQAMAEELQRELADADAKKKAEAAAKDKADAARKAAQERAHAAAELAKAIGTEEAAQQIGQVQNSWALQITSAIQKAWVRQPGTELKLSCKVNIHLLPSGQVVAATIVRGSGNSLFDDSVITAVYKASPLPLPSDIAAFDPSITITFIPR
jgi:colicin import membrane protein